jgi:peptidoglycan L-alanyl-D-glutamate endopeptidase CwlK
MRYKLGTTSKKRLEGVHPDLVKVVELAITKTPTDFTVIEGLRTAERQEKLYESGSTETMNSRHLTGHAVDLGAWVDRSVSWDWVYYHEIARAMKDAAKELGVNLEWGGDWESFKDGPHFQLAWKDYPTSEVV